MGTGLGVSNFCSNPDRTTDPQHGSRTNILKNDFEMPLDVKCRLAVNESMPLCSCRTLVLHLSSMNVRLRVRS